MLAAIYIYLGQCVKFWVCLGFLNSSARRKGFQVCRSCPSRFPTADRREV